MLKFFDRYIEALKGTRSLRVKGAGAVSFVGDWFVEDGKTFVCDEVTHEGGRFKAYIKEIGPLPWKTRAFWALVHVALVASPTIGWWFHG
jgi:hypothetical protein